MLLFSSNRSLDVPFGFSVLRRSVASEAAPRRWMCERGLVVVGPGYASAADRWAIGAFARSTGWPVIADPASNIRGHDLGDEALVVTTAEVLLAAGGGDTAGLGPGRRSNAADVRN